MAGEGAGILARPFALCSSTAPGVWGGHTGPPLRVVFLYGARLRATSWVVSAPAVTVALTLAAP